jgi:1-aminocyclopropane-1-carboxylate deaminase
MLRAAAVFNTPVYSPLQRFVLTAFEQAGVEVWLKRDDLIHPFVSGNKWRKLKYNLMEAEQQGRTHLLTFGGAYSNHLVAVACAAAMCGFSSTGLVRGDEGTHNHMLHLCRTFGMELIFVSREAYRDKQALSHTYAQEYSYVLPEGGTNALAVAGCAEVAAEIPEAFNHVFLASGTGGTTAGVAKGFAQHYPNTHVHSIAVLKGADFLLHDIEALYPNLHNFTLHTAFHEGGYAKTSERLLALIHHTAAHTGVIFDQVYTGKMLLAFLQMLQDGSIARGSRVLLLHTGGTLGWLSQE